MSTRRQLVVIFCAAAAAPWHSGPALAQGRPEPAPARITGRVTDKRSGAAVPGAELLLVAEGRVTGTDSTGTFTIPGVPAGEVHLLVRARHYPRTEVIVRVAPGDDVGLPIELDSTATVGAPQRLATVAVTEKAPLANYRLTDFERRRRTGLGQYLTEEELRTSGAANLQDATRGMRGLTLHCGGTEYVGCRIQIVRAKVNCLPEYVVDGQVDNVFGPLTPIGDIIAVEVYTGAADVPGEFAGTHAGCGVIALWTRSGPTRRRR